MKKERGWPKNTLSLEFSLSLPYNCHYPIPSLIHLFSLFHRSVPLLSHVFFPSSLHGCCNRTLAKFSALHPPPHRPPSRFPSLPPAHGRDVLQGARRCIAATAPQTQPPWPLSLKLCHCLRLIFTSFPSCSRDAAAGWIPVNLCHIAQNESNPSQTPFAALRPLHPPSPTPHPLEAHSPLKSIYHTLVPEIQGLQACEPLKNL